MVIYKGCKAVCGIQLTIDRVWRYALQSEETLTVTFFGSEGETILEKEYTSDDVDEKDLQITVELSEAETNLFSPGIVFITAEMNGLKVIKPKEIEVKEKI